MSTRRTLLTIILSSAVTLLSAMPANAYYYQQAAQSYCREYIKDVYIGGRLQQSYGTACMQPDGAWEVQQDYGLVPSGYRPSPDVMVIREPEPYPVYVNRPAPAYVVAPQPFPLFSLNIRSYDNDRRWNDKHSHYRGDHEHRGHGRGHHGHW